MFSILGDSSAERFVARRASGWRQLGSTVILELEGTREPDTTNVAAILAGARLDDAFDSAELAVSVLESGTVRLVLGPSAAAAEGRDLGVLAANGLAAAPLGVTSTDSGLHLASERHGGYGPDPEDVTIEIALDPFGLTIVNAGGQAIVGLAGEPPDAEAQSEHRPAALAWIRTTTLDGETARATTVSLALEPDERLFGLGERSGPLNLVGTTQTVGASQLPAEQVRPPLLLSSRGYGLMVNARSGLSADLGASQPTEYTVLAPEPELDLLIFPSTWLRTALSNATRLTGRASVPPVRAFGLVVAGGSAADGDALGTAGIPHEPAPAAPDASVAAGGGVAPGSIAEMRMLLQRGLTAGLAAPEHWHAGLGAAPDTGAPASPALLIRWAQLATLSPLVSLTAPVPDGRALDILRAYSQLRYRLLPYLFHCARETADSGLPMLRPLLVEHAWDPEAAEIDDQFLLGRDLLVAPVVSDSGAPVTRRVYLPGYANWYDWWTGILYDGRQWIETTAPLDRLPLYVRAGTAIPLTDPRQSIEDRPVDVTRLLLFAPKESAIGASIELANDEIMGVEQERGDRKARFYLEGIPQTVRDLEIVGLPAGTSLVDASASNVVLEPGDGVLPGQGATWTSLTVRLDPGAFTVGLELSW